MTQRKTPGKPDWPGHHRDAPPPEDPRSLMRGLMAGAAVLLIGVALAIVGPWSEQTGILITLLGWIVAVGFGAWAHRGRSPRVVTITRVVLLLGIISVIVAAALVFVSLQVREILAGTVIFGTSGSDCTIEGEADSFIPGESVYALAHMRRVIETGEEMTLLVSWDGQMVTEGSEVSPRDFDCLGSSLEPLEPGSYAVEVSVAGELLAEGSFEVLPEGE
ncbi:MAG: hypothetical protein DRQ55_20070 [Planctomycetota bacterium]|nr:MAG: hypothetical protein DRQ55_20070 [Planctomycetota bacterium]